MLFPHPTRTLRLVSALALSPVGLLSQTASEPAPTPSATALDDAALDRMILGLDQAPGVNASPALWFQDLKIAAVGGYSANILYTPKNSVDSAFDRAELEWSLYRLPPSDGRLSAIVFLRGEYESYLSHRDQLEDQSFAFGFARAAWKAWQPLTFALKVQGSYSKQYFGLALSDTLVSTVGIANTGWGGEPAVEWSIRPKLKLTLSALREWSAYDNGRDDYHDIGQRLHLAWTRERSEFWVAAGHRTRDYDLREARTSLGFSVVGSHVSWQIWLYELGASFDLGPDDTWSAATRVTYRTTDDDRAGYDDNRRTTVRQSIDFHRGPWRASASVLWMGARYPIQQLTLVDSTRRNWRSLGGELEVTRELSKRFQLRAIVTSEDLTSNRQDDTYTVFSSHLGVIWSFGGL